MNHYASKKQFDNIMYYAYSDIGRMISYDICKIPSTFVFCKNRYGVYNQQRSMVLLYQTAILSLILHLCFRLTIYVPLNSEVLVSGCTKSCQVVLTRLHQ